MAVFGAVWRHFSQKISAMNFNSEILKHQTVKNRYAQRRTGVVLGCVDLKAAGLGGFARPLHIDGGDPAKAKSLGTGERSVCRGGATQLAPQGDAADSQPRTHFFRRVACHHVLDET